MSESVLLPILDTGRDTGRQHRHACSYLLWHRWLDFALAVPGLFIFLLLLPALALFIKLDTPGAVFYRQQRVGYRGRCFTIYKLRSMYEDAEVTGARWASIDDPRVTRVGRWLRATHLDELPQLLNVLRGDMSIIGPRPERAIFITTLEQYLPDFHLRLQVRPGLTGWAQVCCPYTNSVTEARRKLHYDLAYINRWSPGLDLAILGATLREMVRCNGR